MKSMQNKNLYSCYTYLFTTETQRKGTEMPKIIYTKRQTFDNAIINRLIERWKNENMSNRKITGLLGKSSPQTINNEIKTWDNFTTSAKRSWHKKSIPADIQTVYQTNRKQIGEQDNPNETIERKCYTGNFSSWK